MPPKRPRIIPPSDDPAALAARDAVRMAAEALALYQGAALEGDSEAVHQMRIATRRLRVTLELFAGVMRGAWVDVTRRELKWLGGVIGALRDCDVIAQLIGQRGVKLAAETAAGLEPIRQTLSARRRELQGSMREALASDRYESLLARVATPPARKLVPAATVRVMAPELLAPIGRRVDRAGAKLKPESDDRAFHKLRIRIKRLRYSLEMLAESGGGDVKEAARCLRKMQNLLGEQHDVVIAIGWLREFAAAPGSAPAGLVACGALMQSLDRRARKLSARCINRWKKVDRGGIIQDALKVIARGADHPRRETHTVDAA
jgi:CHAD domain-containing protein